MDNQLIKISGKALKLTGKVIKKNHLYFLGHYLEGSGKYLYLDRKFYPYIKEQFNYYVLNHFGAWDIYKENEYFSIEVDTTENHELFNSIGKYKVFIGQGYLYVEDKYEFYAWCKENLHYADCKCNRQKDWGSVEKTLDFRFIYKIYTTKWYQDYIMNKFLNVGFLDESNFKIEKIKFGKILRLLEKARSFIKVIKLFDETVKIIIRISYITVEISDKFWAKLGKPFYIFAKIPLGE